MASLPAKQSEESVVVFGSQDEEEGGTRRRRKRRRGIERKPLFTPSSIDLLCVLCCLSCVYTHFVDVQEVTSRKKILKKTRLMKGVRDETEDTNPGKETQKESET